MTVDTRDILLKAAKDVTAGMWCKGAYYQGPAEDFMPETLIPAASNVLDMALKSHRCAEGSLGIATKLLGGSVEDYQRASDAIPIPLIAYNDSLPDDPFEAGQQLAELFRSTAEAL